MKSRARTLLSILLLGTTGATTAGSPEGWDCRYCPEYQPDHEIIETGLSHSTGDSVRFPSADTPSNPAANRQDAWVSAQSIARTSETGLLDIQMNRLGLANPHFQGDYRASPKVRWQLDYAEWQSRLGPVTQTVFSNDESRLSLPMNWLPASQTAAMDLDSHLRPYRDDRQRKRLKLASDWRLASHWTSHLDVSHEHRTGRDHTYGSFLTQSSFLPRPLDDSTSTLHWTARYLRTGYAADLTYHVSRYRNAFDSLRWNNPFRSIATGADTGELANAPDNQAQRLELNASYRAREAWRFGASAMLFRNTQDEELLTSSSNPNLPTALPRTGADAKIEGAYGLFFAHYQPNAQWRWRLSHRVWERNNRTAEVLFPQIVTDSFASAGRRTIAYDFRDQLWTLDTCYRPTSTLSLDLDLEQQTRVRSQQLRRETREDRAQAKARWRIREDLELRVRAAWQTRDGSAFEPLATQGANENNRQRAFNLADRRRDNAAVDLLWQHSEQLQLGITADWIHDDYPDSPIGLQASTQDGWQAQASGLLPRQWSWALHLGQQTLKLRQTGSESGASWRAAGHDETQTFGLGLTKPELVRLVDLNLSYQWTRTQSDSAVADSAFPRLSSTLHNADLRAVWHWRSNIDWELLYRYERFRNEDWQRFSLAPDAIPNVLGWNADPNNDVGHLIALSARYRF